MNLFPMGTLPLTGCAAQSIVKGSHEGRDYTRGSTAMGFGIGIGGLVLASCLSLHWLLGSFAENTSYFNQFIVLLVLVPGGAVPFLAVAWWLRIPEFGWLLGERFARS